MSFTKITNTQLNSRGATTLPNQPTISAAALKEEFDAPAKQIVAPAVNNLIDELQAVTSAASLGAVAPTGRTGATVQALLTDISDDLAAVETDSHTHSNKTYIDKISEDSSGNPLYDGSPIGAGAAWGDITGTLSNQTDLQTALNGKANSSHTHTKSQITDFPSLATVATSGSYNDLSNKPTLATVATSGSYNDLSNKPTIPDELSDLSDDSTHRLVSDTEKSTWNGKSTVTYSQTYTAAGQKIGEITIDGNKTDIVAPAGGSPGTGAVDSVNGYTGTVVLTASDVGAASSSHSHTKSDISDLGTIGTAAALDVPVSGNASTSQVVKGDDSRLTDSRTPTSHTHTKSDITDFPSLATVATSGSYSDLSNKPTIPAAANNATLTIQQNGTTKGTFTADASTNASANIVTDQWHGTTGTVSSGSVSFSGVDDSDNNGYELFVTVTSSSTNKNPTAQISSISGEGTSSMSITFTTDADNGATCKLRIIK